MDHRPPVPSGATSGPTVHIGSSALDVVSALATALKEPTALAHSAVRLVRAWQRNRFVDQLEAEWVRLIVDGRIADDYGSTDQCRAGFADILESLEDSNFDQDQLDLLRKLFLAAASENSTDRESPLPREYLAIGRTLSSGEIEILAQTYRYLPEWHRISQEPLSNAAEAWMDLMRARTRLEHQALIGMHERKLVDKGLLEPRMHSDGSGLRVSPERYRLTDLGFAFCEFLASYDELAKAAKE